MVWYFVGTPVTAIHSNADGEAFQKPANATTFCLNSWSQCRNAMIQKLGLSIVHD